MIEMIDRIVRLPGDGVEYPMETGSMVRFKVLGTETGGAFEVYEREVPPHTIGADPHYHENTEELFYVVAGQATILAGEDRKVYGAGSAIVVPRMTVHGYWNDSDEPIKLLITFCPALDHDQFFLGLSELKRGPRETYKENLAALRRRFDSVSVEA